MANNFIQSKDNIVPASQIMNVEESKHDEPFDLKAFIAEK